MRTRILGFEISCLVNEYYDAAADLGWATPIEVGAAVAVAGIDAPFESGSALP